MYFYKHFCEKSFIFSNLMHRTQVTNNALVFKCVKTGDEQIDLYVYQVGSGLSQWSDLEPFKKWTGTATLHQMPDYMVSATVS